MTVDELIVVLQAMSGTNEVMLCDPGGQHHAIVEVVSGTYVLNGLQVGAPGSNSSPEAPEGSDPYVVIRS